MRQAPDTKEDQHGRFAKQIFRHRAALHRYLRRFASDAEEVEDLVQETYVRCYALRDSRQIASPRALLFRIAHDTAIERSRRRSTQSNDSAAVQVDSRRRFEWFCAAVERLPPLCRRVFVLRKVYRLSHAEIADALGVSHGTIDKHVAKGLVRCRNTLRELGLMDPKTSDGAPAAHRVRDGGQGE
jgi:RNA polymerase sigma-70 factor (ECF subfamily)